MANTSCYNCLYLSKRPGVGNYFIFKCSYWGIISQKILPQSVVIESIGKKCPFFTSKKKNINNKKSNKKDIDDKDDDFDITV